MEAVKHEAVKSKDIIDTAIANGSLETLASALKAAALIETLKGKGPFTVFAPNDAAFAKLPKETLDSLLKPENKAKLAGILTYHVVPGTKHAKDLTPLKSLKTVQGSELQLKTEAGKVVVGSGHVTKADIECSNGVIHVIDTVAMPK